MVDHQRKAVRPPQFLTPQVPLAPYTTLRVGGEARWFGVVETIEELREAAQFALQTALPFRVIGGGSNLLVPDEGYDGVVVQNAMKGIQFQPVRTDIVLVTVGAGEILDEVIAEMVTRGYWGLENLSAIPGTVGATPIQNVGAYGVEVSDQIVSVECYHPASDTVHTMPASACQFGYRDSWFKTTVGREQVITSVTFMVSTTPRPQLTYADLARALSASASLEEIRSTIVMIRKEKFPDWTRIGTAGSFFKNPIITKALATDLKTQYPDLPVYPVSDTHMKVSLGYILDKVCGLKGYADGGVSLYAKQALVLVNEQSSAARINRFEKVVTDIVSTKTNITIEREVTLLA